jgi:hypothetical protein
VGCKSDGQDGPEAAPKGKSKVVPIGDEAAQQLAYYAADTYGVLAPRGWYCFGTYGSDGDALYVSPEPIDRRNLLSDAWGGFTGPVIQLSREDGDSSARYSVAKTIARVFPAHRAFVDAVIAEGSEPASSFPLGPYATDRLIYKGNEIVEYETPADAEGFGTDSHLKRNTNPISGVAILMGEDLDLLHLSVRLDSAQAVLSSAIIQQVERDVARQSKTVPHDSAP